VLALEETAEIKQKSGMPTVGVARQYAGVTGQVENCQVVVFLAYIAALARARALVDFALYLPEHWVTDQPRRAKAGVPNDVTFATKPELAVGLLRRAVDAAVPFAWVVATRSTGGQHSCASTSSRSGAATCWPSRSTSSLPDPNCCDPLGCVRRSPSLWQSVRVPLPNDAQMSIETIILTALAVEADAVVRSLGSSVVHRWRGKDLHIGAISGKEVLVLPLGAMGNASSAQAVQRAIGMWNPAQIMVVGITGGARGTGDDLRLGDVLVPDQIVGYDTPS
jgi:DDE superfamily endonuclease/Phosphorylase superfamily